MTRKQMIAILHAAYPTATIVYSRRFGGYGTLPRGWWAQYNGRSVWLGTSLSRATSDALLWSPNAQRE